MIEISRLISTSDTATLYWGVAFALWAVGFCIGRFNSFNITVAEIAPVHAKSPWVWRIFVVPFILRLLSWAFMFSSAVLLYFTETINFHLEDTIVAATALVFFSCLLASKSAWRAFAKKYPDALDYYKFKKHFEHMIK